MTSDDVIGVLAELSVASTAAILVVLLLRGGLRRWFGAGASYAVWSVVPATIIAVLLPATAEPSTLRPTMLGAVGVVAGLDARVPSLTVPAAWILAAWAAGAVAMAARFALQQRSFLASLGDLRPREDGVLQAAVVAGLPAVVGLLRPRMVLPADFEARYTNEQQQLLRAHEREHVARGDLWANACVAALRCASWFNPLVHLAARRFRHDQELACDQRVLAMHPGARRAYGEALFNTQLAAQPLPLGCHWGFGHPLKERIAMLKQPLPNRRRWIAGTSLVTLLTLSAGVAAWAAQPSVPDHAADTSAPSADQGPRSLRPPKYPAAALAQGVSGKVVLLVDLDAQGNPTAIAVKSAEPAAVFNQAAMDAVRDWKFEPAIENGKPVASQVLVPVHFESDGDPPEEGSHTSGAMGWTSPSEGSAIAEMTCDEVRVEAGGEPECGNRMALDR